MLYDIVKLNTIANAPSRLIVGLMSGTSLDGLDVALCKISGAGSETKLELLNFKTVDYDTAFKQKIRNVFAHKKVDFEFLTLLHPFIGECHANIILDCLKAWNVASSSVDLIASHGQTVFHAPKSQHDYSFFNNGTLQIGDGDVIAVNTGIITLSDFRQKHIAAGGEGAPLAAYGDYILFRSTYENRILLNLGGIANYTFLPANCAIDQIFVTDTGPGNTLLDHVVRAHFPKKAFDENAELALSGKVNESLLEILKHHSFFNLEDARMSKTTGPEVFGEDFLEDALKLFKPKIQVHDILATLCELTAISIAENIEHNCGEIMDDYVNSNSTVVYLSGGGAHNPLIVSRLQHYLPNCIFKKTNDLGINGDAKEAILFATLANECVAGIEKSGASTKNMPSVSMGKISLPH